MPLKKHRAAMLAAGVIAVASSSAFATTLLQMSFEDLVADASVVVVAEAVDTRVEETADGLMTFTRFSVDDAIVGGPGSTIEVAVAGGAFKRTMNDGRVVKLSDSGAGAPLFPIGRQQLLFLGAGPADAFSILGTTQGAAAVFEAPRGMSVRLPDAKRAETLGEARARIVAEREAGNRARGGDKVAD